MNLIASLLHLFESAEQKKTRITEELKALRAQVNQQQPKASAIHVRDAYADAWVKIGELERQLARLNGTIVVGKFSR